MKLETLVLIACAVFLSAACEQEGEETFLEAEPTSIQVSSSPTLPPRMEVPAPWISDAYLPWELGHTFTAPDPECDNQTAHCEAITTEFDPNAPIGSAEYPCDPADAPPVPYGEEMVRRARLRNGVDCANGWQYEWAGLSATPEPTPPDPWIRDDGVLTGLIADCFGGDPDCVSGPRTCIADGYVLIKDGKVHEEPVSGSEELPDYDEIYLSHAVHRDDSGVLISGYRQCWEGTEVNPP